MTHPTQPKNARSIARLGAVQSLYEMEISGKNASQIIEECIKRAYQHNNHSGYHRKADHEFLKSIIGGVVDKQTQLDKILNELCLNGGRALAKLEILMRALLRAGAWEMLYADTPPKVIINEYLNIAHQFFAGGESRFINGILDALKKHKEQED